MWFYVPGIYNPSVVTPEIESEVLVGFPAAEHYLGFQRAIPRRSTCVRRRRQVAAVDSVLAATANPQNPSEVDVSQPSSALVARADAQGNAVHRDHTYL